MKTILSLIVFLVFSGNVLFGQVIVNLTPTNVTCNGMCNGAINMNVTGGTPPYTYLWNSTPPQFGSTATNLCAGTYTVTVTDNIGTTGTATTTIAQPPVLTATISSQTNVSCNGMCDGTATITNSGGTPPYTYFWSPTGGNTTVATNLCAGVYSVTATDANACTSVTNVTITQPAALTATITGMLSYCAGSSTTLDAGAGYTNYIWSTVAATQTINVTSAGNYSVTVTNANLCTGTTSVNISVNALPTVSAGMDQTVCASNPVVNLNGNISGGTTSGIWTTTGTGTFSPDNTSLNATYVSSVGDIMSGAVVLTLTSTNNGSCNAVTDQIIITIMPAPVVNAGADQSVCAGTSEVLTGSGAISYIWDNGVINGTPFTPLVTSTYSVTGTDVNGCTNTDQVVVTVIPMPNANAGPDVAVCQLSNVMNATQSVGVGTWTVASGGSINFSPSENSPNATITVGNTGVYTLVWTGNNNGCIDQDTVIVQLTQTPTSDFTMSPISCFGDASMVTYTGTGNGLCLYTWAWNSATAIPGTGIGPHSAFWSTIGTQTVGLIVSLNNCTSPQTLVTITQPAAISATTNITDATCLNNDGQIGITVSGGTPLYTYLWSNLANLDIISGLNSGTYSLTVADANGCTYTSSYVVNQSSSPATLNGTVSYSGGFLPAGDGTVNLFKESTSGGGQFDSIASQTITVTGYNFNNLMPGNYHIGVTLTNPSAYPNLMNTYYNNHFLWTDADTIILACNDNITLPITMYEFVSSPPGNCDLSGTIVYGNYTGFKNTKAAGEPVPGAEILIEQEPNDVPIQSAITDINGNYLLTNIAEGFGYHLLVDIPGYPILSTYVNLTINPTDTLLNNLNFIFDTSSTGGIFIDTATGFSNPLINSGIISMNIFPNPASHFINVNFELSQNVDIAAELISITGAESKELINKPNCQKGSYNYKVSVPQNFAEGSYLLKIKAGNNIIVKKLILKK